MGTDWLAAHDKGPRQTKGRKTGGGRSTRGAEEDPLVSARQKLERANEHLKELWEESKTFVEGGNFSLRSESNLEGHDPRFGAGISSTSSPTPPARWSLLAGDAVQNLYAVLDHAAWTLTVHVKGEPWAWQHKKNIYFPMRTSRAAFTQTFLVKNLPPDLVAMLDKLQPYERNPQPVRDALWPFTNCRSSTSTVLNVVVLMASQSTIKIEPPVPVNFEFVEQGPLYEGAEVRGSEPRGHWRHRP